jgi:hypothetical protein
MELNKLAPIVEEAFKKATSAKVYLFGKKSKGLTNRVATGSFRNSIKAKVITNIKGETVVQVFGKSYKGGGSVLINDFDSLGAILTAGRRAGKFPPTGPIKQWIIDKKIKLRDNKGRFVNRNEKNINNAAFLIARSIAKFGIKNKPKNLTDVAIDYLEKDARVATIIEEATFEEILNIIEGI